MVGGYETAEEEEVSVKRWYTRDPDKFLPTAQVRVVLETDYDALQAENERLREALRPLAGIPYQQFNDRRPEHILMAWNSHSITVSDVQTARAALAGKP